MLQYRKGNKMSQKIILTIVNGGVSCLSGLPLGTEIEIRDYDVQGVDSEVLKEDDDGDEYQEILLTNDD